VEGYVLAVTVVRCYLDGVHGFGRPEHNYICKCRRELSLVCGRVA
jgi:hypothetical protein